MKSGHVLGGMALLVACMHACVRACLRLVGDRSGMGYSFEEAQPRSRRYRVDLDVLWLKKFRGLRASLDGRARERIRSSTRLGDAVEGVLKPLSLVPKEVLSVDRVPHRSHLWTNGCTSTTGRDHWKASSELTGFLGWLFDRGVRPAA